MSIIALVIYLLVGIVTGIMSGLFGIGGGVIVVPSLALLFGYMHFHPDFVMHLAVGTSLTIMVGTTLNAVRQHSKKNSDYFPIYWRLAVGLIPGIFAGSILGHYLHGHVLRLVFGVLILLVSLKMLLPFPDRKNEKGEFCGHVGMAFMGFFTGVISALLGVGGGFITVPFLTRYGVNMHLAIMISAMVGFTVGVLGCIVNIYLGWNFVGLPQWSTGYVFWPAAIAVVLGTLFAVPIGANWAYRLPTESLRKLFAVLLLCIGVHMLF